jgi:hypothetical protein
MVSKDKTYRTRDGREVRIYATDGGAPDGVSESVHGAVKNYFGWSPAIWKADGKHSWGAGSYSCPNPNNDLIEVKPRVHRIVWLNVHPTVVRVYSNREQADNDALSYSFKDRLACVKVEIDCEEGEGL